MEKVEFDMPNCMAKFIHFKLKEPNCDHIHILTLVASIINSFTFIYEKDKGVSIS